MTLIAVAAMLGGYHPVNAQQNMKREIPVISAFPVANVTFEPGCRNNWHSHTGGQLLIAVGGKGYYQARGEAARVLLPGDVVEIPVNVEHWHGAAPDSWFSHLARNRNGAARNTMLKSSLCSISLASVGCVSTMASFLVTDIVLSL